MLRRIVALGLILLAACGAPASATPAASPPPSRVALPTMAPAGATVLASDYGKTSPPRALTTPSLTVPSPTAPAASTPRATDWSVALRPQFRAELDKIKGLARYEMQWDLSADASELRGRQRVFFTNRTGKELDEIYLRLFANATPGEGGITLHQVLVDERSADIELSQNGTVARLILGETLAPEHSLVVTLDYTVEIPKDATGRYSDFTQTAWLTTLPTIYPLIPAYDENGWHLENPPEYGDVVYADSSIYDVTINTPSDYQVIASGELVQEIPQGNRITRRFIAAPMRDFNANLTNVLTQVSAQVDDVTVTSWHKPEDAAAGQRALDWAVNALRVYEKRFGAYPFRSLDVVESPTTAGGIEYPGVITVSSNLYQDPGQTSFFEFATAHEVAHQWFYSVIGNDQVNHPWQDEALAQYATTIYFEDRYGAATARQIRDDYFQQQYVTGEQKYGDLPAGLPVEAYAEDAYSAFVYSKGPLFFQAVRDQIGDDAFFRALQTYFQRFKFGIATPLDLINVFQQASGRDITPLYLKWIGN